MQINDVFISYRRKDIAFVRRLDGALREDERTIWIDWEDIPPGSENFNDDIRSGIASSSVFIAVLSPAYLESPYCMAELYYAIESKKRLVPLVLEMVNPDDLPGVVRDINWIYFIPHAGHENDFETAMQNVRRALDSDYDYLREHTRLLNRAQTWERQGNDASFLLTGRELEAAETWLQVAQQKQPGLTELHTHFIFASRRAMTRRQRTSLIIVTIMLFIVSCLALGAFVLYRQTEAQRVEILQQRRESDSRRLAVQALAARDDGQTDLALLLAREANVIAQTREAQGSLLSVLDATPYLRQYLYRHDRDWRTTIVTITGDLLAADDAGRIWVWRDNASQPELFAEHGDGIWSLVNSPNGQIVASGGEDEAIRLWDTDGGALIAELTGHDGAVYALAYSPDGAHLLSAGEDGTIRIWDGVSGELQSVIEAAHPEAIWDIAFRADGQQFATASEDMTLQLWSSDSLEREGEAFVGHRNWVFSVRYDETGQRLVSASADQTVRIWDVATGEARELTRHSGFVRRAFFVGDAIVTVADDGALILWDAERGLPRQAPLMVHPGRIRDMALYPDGHTLATVGSDSLVLLWDLNDQHALAEDVLTDAGRIQDVILDMASGEGLAVALDGTLTAFSPAGIASMQTVPDMGRVLVARYHPGDGWLALGAEDGRIHAWDTDEQISLGQFDGHTSAVFDLAFSSDGHLASASDDRTVRVWDTGTRTQVGHIDLESGALSIAISSDGTWLAAGLRTGVIHVWRMAQLSEPGFELMAHTDAVEALSFSLNGRWLASASRDRQVLLWPVAGWPDGNVASAETLSGHSDWVLGLAYSPDGRLLASGGRDQSVVLWDMTEQAIVGRQLALHTDWVRGLVFAADSNQLFSSAEDGRVIAWQIQPQVWADLACRIANRSFTPAEVRQLLPGIDPSPCS